jgi:hypothetical protein
MDEWLGNNDIDNVQSPGGAINCTAIMPTLVTQQTPDTINVLSTG